MTLEDPLIFDLPCWKKVSDSAKDLITKLLIKDPTKRINLKDALQHEWLQL
jgi:calcium-dependent protein kinase